MPVFFKKIEDMRTATVFVCIVFVALCAVVHIQEVPLRLAVDDAGNESLVVQLRGGVYGRRSAYLVDTAFSGAPVVSLSYAAHLKSTPSLRHMAPREQHRRVARLPKPREEQMDAALRELIVKSRSRVFTSGCTMRLASIGEITESHSDMILAGALRTGGLMMRGGDVFVTNELAGSVNVLTSDFLYHRAPVLVAPAKGKIVFRAAAWRRYGFRIERTTLVAGAPSVAVVVGGVSRQLILDTGASSCVCLNPGIRFHGLPSDQKVVQRGVNGERVCGAVSVADVEIAGFRLPSVQVVQNTAALPHADGYVGLGVLRAFDLLVSFDYVGFKRSGLPVLANSAGVQPGAC